MSLSGTLRTAVLLLGTIAAVAQEPEAKPEWDGLDSLPPKKAAL